jgi:hypothetical protein
LDELIQYRIATLEYRKFLSKGVPEGLRFSAKNPLFFSLKEIVRRAIRSQIVRRAIRSQIVRRAIRSQIVRRAIRSQIVRRGDHFGEHRSQRRSFILSTVSPRSHRKSKGRYSRRQQTRHKAKSPYFFTAALQNLGTPRISRFSLS